MWRIFYWEWGGNGEKARRDRWAKTLVLAFFNNAWNAGVLFEFNMPVILE